VGRKGIRPIHVMNHGSSLNAKKGVQDFSIRIQEQEGIIRELAKEVTAGEDQLLVKETKHQEILQSQQNLIRQSEHE
jgi:hypothetical protein